MSFIFFFMGWFLLFYSVKKLAKVNQGQNHIIKEDIIRNSKMLVMGLMMVLSLFLIISQVWVMTGGSHDWDGVYVVGGTIVLTLLISFWYFFKTIKLK